MESIHLSPPSPTPSPIILLLVGLPGSGKSTLSHALVSTGKWTRASQDDAPNKRRQEAEEGVRRGLREGWKNMEREAGCWQGVVVDRCGFDVSQRAHFIRIAREPEFQAMNIRIWCIVLLVPQPLLLHRLLHRPPHPTIPPSKASFVLSQMIRSFSPPTRSRKEGFNKVLVLDWENMNERGWWGSERKMAEVILLDGEEKGNGAGVQEMGGWTGDEAMALVRRIGDEGWEEDLDGEVAVVEHSSGRYEPRNGNGGFQSRGGFRGLSRGGGTWRGGNDSGRRGETQDQRQSYGYVEDRPLQGGREQIRYNNGLQSETSDRGGYPAQLPSEHPSHFPGSGNHPKPKEDIHGSVPTSENWRRA